MGWWPNTRKEYTTVPGRRKESISGLWAADVSSTQAEYLLGLQNHDGTVATSSTQGPARSKTVHEARNSMGELKLA